MQISRTLIIIAFAFPSFAQTPLDEPYRVTHPSDRVTCVSPGLEVSPITSCVIESDAGPVLIDTGLSPSMGSRTRARIAAELGRDDVRWVINTHSHFDHSGGNQAWGDTVIIGHENTRAAIHRFYDGREAWIERRKGWLARQQEAAENAEPGSKAATALAERLRFNRELIEDLKGADDPAAPSLTFSDHLTLFAEDLEFRLIFFGRAHTESDILVHIPALGVLFTGDLFHKEVLGVAAGSPALDVERWIETLDLVLAGQPAISTVIGGHGLIFEPQWIAGQLRYLREVWSATIQARGEGLNFVQLSENLPFDDRFSYAAELLALPAENLDEQHARVLQGMWDSTGESIPGD